MCVSRVMASALATVMPQLRRLTGHWDRAETRSLWLERQPVVDGHVVVRVVVDADDPHFAGGADVQAHDGGAGALVPSLGAAGDGLVDVHAAFDVLQVTRAVSVPGPVGLVHEKVFV